MAAVEVAMAEYSLNWCYCKVEPIHADSPDFNQLQAQIVQLQSHLGLAPSTSSGPMTAIVVDTLTALHGKSSHPTWILDSGFWH